MKSVLRHSFDIKPGYKPGHKPSINLETRRLSKPIPPLRRGAFTWRWQTTEMNDI